MKSLLAAIVRRRDIDRLHADRCRASVAGGLEQFAELDIDPGLGRRAVVNQHRVTGQQVVLMQRRRVGIVAIESGQHDFQSLCEQVILQRFNGGFIFRVADQVEFGCSPWRCTAARGGRRFRFFLRRRQTADEILLEQIQIAFNDFGAMVQDGIFLHAEHKRALTLVGDLAASRHPDQALQIEPESSIGRQTHLQGLDRFGRVFRRDTVTLAQQMHGDGALGQTVADDGFDIFRQHGQRCIGQHHMAPLEQFPLDAVALVRHI
jgi:hypothetical protein